MLVSINKLEIKTALCQIGLISSILEVRQLNIA
nr:hypothetical protein [Staphylococcus schweitzeri]